MGDWHFNWVQCSNSGQGNCDVISYHIIWADSTTATLLFKGDGAKITLGSIQANSTNRANAQFAMNNLY